MSLNRARLKWLTILAPIAYMLILSVFFLTEHTHTNKQWLHNISMTLGLGLIGVVPFSLFVFHRVRLQEEELVRRSEAMAALAAIGKAITGSFDLEVNLRSLLERARALMDGEVAVLCLVNGRSALVPKVRLGPQEIFSEHPTDSDSPSGRMDCIPGHMSSLGISREDLACFGIKDGAVRTLLKAPMLNEGKIIGALCIARTTYRLFSSIEEEVLNDLATLAAIAVENARLQEQLKSMALIEERQRIAREMHDGLAQDLAYLHTKFAHLEQKIASRQIDESLADLKEMKQVAREAYEEVRQAIHGFRSMVPRGHGLIAALTDHLDQIEERSGISMKLAVADDAALRFRPWVEIQLSRIIQEALANVRKHSQAKHAWVAFHAENEVAKVIIRDDGIGFELDGPARVHGRSFGLKIMKERAEEIGGDLFISSEPGQGTTVEVQLPLGS